MIFRQLLIAYLLALIILVVVPLGELNTTLTDRFVFELRLDYLVHGLVFLPVPVLWCLGFPGHPIWAVLLVSLALAVGLEGVQYLLPWRAWNVNDALGNSAGLILGAGCEMIRKRMGALRF